ALRCRACSHSSRVGQAQRAHGFSQPPGCGHASLCPPYTGVMPSRKQPEDLAPATMSEADGVRYLHLGTPWVKGAMRIRKPQTLELEYIQRMMAWMLLRPAPQLTRGHAVQLGLGAA